MFRFINYKVNFPSGLEAAGPGRHVALKMTWTSSTFPLLEEPNFPIDLYPVNSHMKKRQRQREGGRKTKGKREHYISIGVQ